MKIIFATHSTTLDNEQKIASGWFDVPLSPLGCEQAQALGKHFSETHVDAIYTSDLQRAYRTATLAFPGRAIIQDKRLRECHYGDLTRRPLDEIHKADHIDRPFPGGESYQDTTRRIASFLADLSGSTVLIIGHRATQYALEHLINRVPLKEAVLAPWQWQPGWTYDY